MGIHDQHRQRLKDRFLREGLDGFQEHEALELLLFFSIPQKDTNELAHVLLNKFGALSGVFEASFQNLCEVPGVGAHTATLLTMMPGLLRRYYDRIDRKSYVLKGTEEIVGFLRPQFLGRTKEHFYLICENNLHQILFSDFLSEGEVNNVPVSVRTIMEICMSCRATGVILAHNHPGALALPSQEDLHVTQALATTLRPVGITLRDHIILDDMDAISLRDSGYLARLDL